MKVICIEEGMNESGGKSSLIEGETYTVIRSKNIFSNYYKKQFLSYCLSELPAYHAACLFIPLSEIDETEMIREYNTVTKN